MQLGLLPHAPVYNAHEYVEASLSIASRTGNMSVRCTSSAHAQATHLQGVKFGIFGLGNKQYEHFCAVGKRVQAAMLALGATPIIKNGEGDDDDDIEADYDIWREKLHEILEDQNLIQKSASHKVCLQA